ncbi:hypothetical protein [Paracoccus sp. (in: a-proteobacteria)]|uniref:hypothetical protein n=1 Tax=Paracoccus sp. TaxID=267 RepID=UPI00396C4713
MDERIRTAILYELSHQVEVNAELEVRQDGDHLVVHGPVDVDAILMSVAGSVARDPWHQS